jgi:hypothetical protein
MPDQFGGRLGIARQGKSSGPRSVGTQHGHILDRENTRVRIDVGVAKLDGPPAILLLHPEVIVTNLTIMPIDEFEAGPFTTGWFIEPVQNSRATIQMTHGFSQRLT